MFVFIDVMHPHRCSGPPKSGETVRILYAGADRDLCELLPALLAEEDWCVRCVNSAAEALNAAAEYPFDLYLLDSWYLDDGLRGIDLCLQLKRTHPSTPVLFYSADAFRQNIEEALAAGAKGYVVQPDVEDVLPRRISDLLVAASAEQTDRCTS
jgi:CheY-like chemotaxis protein